MCLSKPVVCESLVGPRFVMQYMYKVSFISLRKSKESRLPPGCFTLIAFLLSCDFFNLFLVVPWVGLQCVIVAFPSHTCSFVFFMERRYEKSNHYFNENFPLVSWVRCGA